MGQVKPRDLVLRCYVYRLNDGPHVGVCVDLNIAVQSDSPEQLKKKMNAAIASYIDLVLDTDDKESIPQLIFRRSPLKDWVIYYLIKFLVFIKKIPGNFTFKEYIPFHLAHNC